MPTSGSPGGPTKLPQLRKDFNLAAAKPAPKAPPPPALKYNPPQRVAAPAPGMGKGVPLRAAPAAKPAARMAAPPKPAVAFKRAAQPGLKPAFQRAAKPPVPTKGPPKASPAFNKAAPVKQQAAAQAPAIRAKRDFAKAAANPGAAQIKAKTQQKIQTRTKAK